MHTTVHDNLFPCQHPKIQNLERNYQTLTALDQINLLFSIKWSNASTWSNPDMQTLQRSGIRIPSIHLTSHKKSHQRIGRQEGRRFTVAADLAEILVVSAMRRDVRVRKWHAFYDFGKKKKNEPKIKIKRKTLSSSCIRNALDCKT